MLTVSAAVDHRVVDAAHLGKLFQSLRRQIKKPELLETSLPNPK
jgi:pyruvate/2-oxoglutarate dehydrogenase complex dihydrolipoamide acyltransferase (E2) component